MVFGGFITERLVVFVPIVLDIRHSVALCKHWPYILAANALSNIFFLAWGCLVEKTTFGVVLGKLVHYIELNQRQWRFLNIGDVCLYAAEVFTFAGRVEWLDMNRAEFYAGDIAGVKFLGKVFGIDPWSTE